MNMNIHMDFNIEVYLDSLPEDIEKINIRNRNLTYIPSLERFKNLKILHCNINKLTSLPPLNEKLERLYCGYNQLTSLPPLNENLQELHCGNNQLTYLPQLNENLKELYCANNKLNYLPHLNENLQKLCCYGNPINEIIKGNIRRDKKQIQTINNFRYFYYYLKFKKRFRDLLWLKIREPKIRKKCNPSNLLENIKKDSDFILKLVYELDAMFIYKIFY